uniref:Regulatory protein zeste n=1 Tax=Bactrocera dorsalis TaxID=27457 RepID=A0A034WUH2_BACDO
MDNLDKRQKHTNKKQFEVLVSEMKLHPDIAKGFSQRAPGELNHFWEEISNKLNAVGPPIKDRTGWKKVWTDFKFATKKKMVKNAKQISGTGGGPFSQISLSALEEEVSVILSLNASVEGLKGITSFGCSKENIPEEIPTTSTPRKRPVESIYSQPDIDLIETSYMTPGQTIESNADADVFCTPHKKSKINKMGLLTEQINIQKKMEENVSKLLATLIKHQKDYIQEQSDTNRWLKKLSENEKDKLKEMKRHNAVMEKIAFDKLETKKKILELELEHLNNP